MHSFFNTIQPLSPPLKNNVQNDPSFQAVAYIKKKSQLQA